MINETLFPTKVLNLLGLPDSHTKTTVVSVHANIEYAGTLSIRFAWQSSLARTWAPHSYNLGIDNRLTGETFVFEITSAVCTSFAESSMRR